MKKSDYKHRPQKAGGNGANFGNRQNGRFHKPAGNRSNRPPSKRQSERSAQSWVSSTSALTSHIPTGGRQQPANSRKQRSSNGNGQSASFYKGRETGHKKEKPRYPQKSHKPSNAPEDRRSPAPKPGDSKQGSNDLVAGIDPFELFCAYHLGIEPKNVYKPANINQVGQRFKVDPATIRQATKKYGFDPASMLDKDFDLALAQLDIQVAPEGVSKIELAKGIYEEFLNAPVIKRDWNKILKEDEKENRRVFGG
ncbi:MAG: hypothetical protein ACE5G9_07950 [Nitrospinales bacterium]